MAERNSEIPLVVKVGSISALAKEIPDAERIYLLFQFGAENFQPSPREIVGRTRIAVRATAANEKKVVLCDLLQYGPEMPDVVPFLLQTLRKVRSEIKEKFEEPEVFFGAVEVPGMVGSGFESIHPMQLIEIVRLTKGDRQAEFFLEEFGEIFDDLKEESGPSEPEPEDLDESIEEVEKELRALIEGS